MDILKRACVAGLIAMLAACGGGGNGSAGTPVLGSSGAASNPTSGTAVATSIQLIASAVQVPSGGDQVTITATVKDASNVSMAAAPISFAADSGTLTSASTATDATGAATVILTAGSDRSNRSIVVTATSGSVAGTLTLPVVGTSLTYSGVTTVALNGTVQTTVTAADSKGTAISGLTVNVTSALANTLSAAVVTTNSQGAATVGYTAAHAGTDTLSFSGGGVAKATAISISAEAFAFASPAASTAITVGKRQLLTVQYLSNGSPQTNKNVAFAATAGVLTLADTSNVSDPCTSVAVVSSSITNAAGLSTICIGSATASPVSVQANYNDGSVSAQATLPLIFVAGDPTRIVLQATSTALGPNAADSTTPNAVNVIATVTDAKGNPVSDVVVNFNRIADPSGGSLNQASAKTTTSGQALVQFIAGPTATANNGVQLQATLQDFPAVAAGTASLSVTRSALFIALGTGNSVISLDAQTYQKDWVVYVTDSNGVPVSNVNLTIRALPILYGKGQLYFNKVWGWSQTPNVIATGETLEGDYVCANEDSNYNGVLDPPYSDADGNPVNEDPDGDHVLQPGNVISVTTSSTSGASSGTITTGSTGRATISLVYAKSYSGWVKVRLVASAVVSGTESKTQAEFWAAGAAADYNTETVAPPGQFSPFGVNACNVAN